MRTQATAISDERPSRSIADTLVASDAIATGHPITTADRRPYTRPAGLWATHIEETGCTYKDIGC